MTPDTYNSADCAWFHRKAREALQICRAYHVEDSRKLRVIWQERAADYRETLIDQMRRRQGWSLSGRVTHQRYQSQGGRGFRGKYW